MAARLREQTIDFLLGNVLAPPAYWMVSVGLVSATSILSEGTWRSHSSAEALILAFALKEHIILVLPFLVANARAGDI